MDYNSAILALFSGFMLMVWLIAYVLTGFIYFKLAKKANVRNAWIAFLPIIQGICLMVLMLHMLDKSGWMVLLLFIPIANVVFAIMWTYQFYKAFGIDTVLAIISVIIPIVGLIVMIYMAFSSSVTYQLTNKYAE